MRMKWIISQIAFEIIRCVFCYLISNSIISVSHSYLFIATPFLVTSVCLSLYTNVHVFRSVCLFTLLSSLYFCLSVCLSICLPVCLSVCPSPPSSFSLARSIFFALSSIFSFQLVPQFLPNFQRSTLFPLLYFFSYHFSLDPYIFSLYNLLESLPHFLLAHKNIINIHTSA